MLVSGPGFEAFDHEAVAPVVAGEHRHHRRHHAGHAGHARRTHPRCARTVAACARCCSEFSSGARLKSTMWSVFKPEVDAADVEEALREESRRHEQRHRHRDLHGGERGAEPARRLRAAGLAGLVLQRRRRGRAACCAAPGTGRTRCPVTIAAPPGEDQHRRAQRERDQRAVFRGHDRRDQIERPLRHEAGRRWRRSSPA